MKMVRKSINIASSTESVPLGLLQGGQAITKCKDRFKQLLELLVRVASLQVTSQLLQTSFLTLDEVIRVTSRRVNALEHVVIPRIQDEIQYIKKVLDEQAREDFYRQKKLTDKKRKIKEMKARENEKKAEIGKTEEEPESNPELQEDQESAITNALGDEGDEDLIF